MAAPGADEIAATRRWLGVAVAALGALGLAAEVANHRLQHPGLRPLIAFLSLSFEHNLPTWFASSLLLACAAALAAVARRVAASGGAFRRHWRGLAAAFAYMSLDEAVELHESLGELPRLERLPQLGGALYFAWVVPGAALVALFGLAYLRFVLRLPRATRRAFVVAGAVYVGGALGMELPLGWWTDRYGEESLGYALIDWAEEMLELAGASLFLVAVLRHLMTLQPAPASRAPAPAGPAR